MTNRGAAEEKIVKLEKIIDQWPDWKKNITPYTVEYNCNLETK